MKIKVRVLSLLLCVIMVLGLLPVQVFAATVVASGYCGGEGDGTNLTWTLDSEGTLTISGSGAMANYTSPYNASNKKKLPPWEEYTASITRLKLDNQITTIGDYAFYFYSNLSGSNLSGQLTLPNKLESIGERAFWLCAKITGSLVIPDTVTIIGDGAFSTCSNLTSVTIPNSVMSIGSEAFYQCSNLTSVTIPSSVMTIGRFAFYNTPWLKSQGDFAVVNGILLAYQGTADAITLPDNVTTIGTSAFSNCSSLTSVTTLDSVTSIGDYAFEQCSNLTSITLSSSLMSIGSAAFYNCSSLTSVTIPDGVTSIGSSAFHGCTSLTSITIPNRVSKLSEGVFNGCSSLSSVTIQEGVTSIGAVAFKNCTHLRNVTIPNSVTSIGWNAFQYCSSLTSVTIPSSVTSIGSSAFQGCTSLTSITIPAGVADINANMFYGCSRMTSVTLPNSVTKIGANAFLNCSSLTSIVIPNSVTTISNAAFRGCNSLKSVFFVGNAPTVFSESDFYSSFLKDAVLYYITGKDGWTNTGAYDAAAGTWNGYTLKTWDGPTFAVETPAEDEAPTIAETPYYSTTENRLFRIHDASSGYTSPTGFDVQVGSNHFTSGQTIPSSTDDVTARIPTNYTGSIVISKSGFHTCTMPEELVGQYNNVQMMPDSVTAPFAQMLLSDHSSKAYRSYRNLLFGDSETVTELPVDEEAQKQRLYTSINWNGHGTGNVWLEQGENTIMLNNDSFTEVCLAEKFTANQTVFLCALAADGTTLKTQTTIKMIERLNITIPANFGDSFEIPTQSSQENVSILEGQSLKIDFGSLLDKLPIEAEIKADGTFKGTIGLTLAKDSAQEAAYGKLKEAFSQLKSTDEDQVEANREVAKLLKELKSKKIACPSVSHSVLGISGDVQVLGMFSGKLMNGKFTFTELEFAFIIDGKVSYTHNTTVYGILAYFKIGLSIKISRSIKMKYTEESKALMPTEKQPLTTKITLSAEAGPGWEGYVSGGVQGAGTVAIYTTIPTLKSESSATLQGKLSFVGTLYGLKGTWKILETDEYVFWEAGKGTWHKKEDEESTSLAFNADTKLRTMRFSARASADGLIASNVSGYDRPCLLSLSDGSLLAVWAADVPGRSVTDSSGLYYSIFKEGIWSTPALVWDDGTTDFAPKLQSIGGEVWLVWQNYTKTYNQSSFDAVSLDEISNYCDIAVAKYDETNGNFTATANISCTGYDYAPQLSMQNGAITAAWMNGEKYCTASLTDSGWSAATTQDIVSWYQTEEAMPSTWSAENAPASNSNRQVFSTADYQAIVYVAADDDGRNQVYGLFNDGYGWGDAIALTNVTDGSVGSFRCVIDSDYQIKVLATVCAISADGEYESANLRMFEKDLNPNLTVNSADYIRDTYVVGQTISITADVTNSSGTTVQGVEITASNGTTELITETFGLTLLPGQTKTAYLNYQMPTDFDLDNITITVLPKNVDDIDASDNDAECVFRRIDISVEAISAVQSENGTQILAQIVNRGTKVCSSFQVKFRSGTSDGEVLETKTIAGLQPGELVNISVDLKTKRYAGETIYVEAEQLPGENLYGNNNEQTIVTALSNTGLSTSADSGYADGVLSLNVTITNYEQTPVKMIAIAAAYNSDGKQICSGVSNALTISALQADDVQLTLKSKIEPSEWKVFVLNAETMQPLCIPIHS